MRGGSFGLCGSSSRNYAKKSNSCATSETNYAQDCRMPRNMTNDTIDTARDRYVQARLAFEIADREAKKQLAKLRGMRDVAERNLVEAMEDADKTNFAEKSTGLRFQTSKKFGISVTRENTDAIRAWLLDREGDDQPYIEEKVNKGEVSKLLRQVCDEEGTDVVPDFFKLYRGVGISVVGWERFLGGVDREHKP